MNHIEEAQIERVKLLIFSKKLKELMKTPRDPLREPLRRTEQESELKKSENLTRPQTRHLKPIKPGEVRNPVGRPIGSRSKFSEAMVSDFLADWHEHGTDVLARVRQTEPSTYLRVAAVLVPKEMNVAVEQRTGPMQNDEIRQLRRLIEL